MTLISCGRPTTVTAAPLPNTSIDVVGVAWPFAITVSVCASPVVPPMYAGEIDVHLGDVRAAQIADGNGVRAAQRVHIDAFDVIQYP